ncbi:MAG: acyl--CoA ligase, partial [Gammaproteobacteria bacterium]|nr:acyl--CoA ligase [Gammaproteobacteria bacterium]
MTLVDSPLSRDLTAVLARRVAHCPDKHWIVTADRGYSYREIDTRSGHLAQGLVDLDIVPGDTVLIMLPDTVDYILAWCALSKCGGIEVPVNIHNRGNPLAYLINDSLAKTIIIDVQFLDRIDAIKSELKSLQCLILYDENGTYESPLCESLTSQFEIRRFGDIFSDT